MKLCKAKDYFQNGLIKAFRAVRCPMSSGWMLEIEGTKGSVWMLKKADGELREYKSPVTVVQEVERITGAELKGFRVL